jgi:hypothetical protein
MKRFLLALVLSLFLVGCDSSDADSEVVNVPDVSVRADSELFENITIPAIGSVCGFIKTDTHLEIHPFYNSVKHISLEKFYLSDLPFWDTLLSSNSDICSVIETEHYSIITNEDGCTFGVFPINEDEALLVKSHDLPSGYVKIVMDKLWQQGT